MADNDLREQFCRVHNAIKEVANAMLYPSKFFHLFDPRRASISWREGSDHIAVNRLGGDDLFFVPWDYVERLLAGDETWRREVSEQLEAQARQAQEDLEAAERATLAVLKAKYEAGDE